MKMRIGFASLLFLCLTVGTMYSSWWQSTNNNEKPENNFEFYNKSSQDVTFLLVDLSESGNPLKPIIGTLNKQSKTPWLQYYIPMNRDYRIYIWNKKVTPTTDVLLSIAKFWKPTAQIKPNPDYIYNLIPKNLKQTAYLTWRGNILEPQTGRLGGGIAGYTFTQSGLFFDKNINFTQEQIKSVK